MVALGASILSTGLIQYFLSPYVARATYMSLSHQLNLQNYSLFARRKSNIVNVDDLKAIHGDNALSLRKSFANLKNEADGKYWYVHPEQDISKEFYETLDRPRGGYKNSTGKGVVYKEKLGDNPLARMFEEPTPAVEKEERKG
jgi:hypothetical protein